MGNAGTGAQKEDNKMRIQIVCSILAEVQNQLEEGQKPGDKGTGAGLLSASFYGGRA